MGMLLSVAFTFFIATICGAVLLIQVGGWLPILVAILLILSYMLSTSVILILGANEVGRKKKEKETGEFFKKIFEETKTKEEQV